MTWEVRQGDALEILRHDIDRHSIDAIITDPPYANTGSESSRVSTSSVGAPRETQFFEAWTREHIAEWRRVLKPDGAAWFTVDWMGAQCVEQACHKLGLPRPAIGVWDRGGLGMGFVLRKTYECFIVVRMPEWKRVKSNEPDVWHVEWTPSDRGNGHTAEKPVALFRRAIELVIVGEGRTVLDPFAGSGASGEAALSLGHRFIGIEREPEYRDLAHKRLAAYDAQPPLLSHNEHHAGKDAP